MRRTFLEFGWATMAGTVGCIGNVAGGEWAKIAVFILVFMAILVAYLNVAGIIFKKDDAQL